MIGEIRIEYDNTKERVIQILSKVENELNADKFNMYNQMIQRLVLSQGECKNTIVTQLQNESKLIKETAELFSALLKVIEQSVTSFEDEEKNIINAIEKGNVK